MNSFDRMMREKAGSEKILVPEGFDERIGGIIENLSGRKGVSLNRRKGRKVLLGSIVAAACLTFMMLGYGSIMGFDKVYATVAKIAKDIPYVVGIGRTDDSNSRGLLAVKDDVIFYDSSDNKYVIKSAYRKEDEIRIILAIYFKNNNGADNMEQVHAFKLLSNGLEYTSKMEGALDRPKGMFSKYKNIVEVEISFKDVPEAENSILVYDGKEVALKFEKAIAANQEGMHAEGRLYDITVIPMPSKNMLGTEVKRKKGFPLNSDGVMHQSFFIDAPEGNLFEDDKGKGHRADRLMQRNEFVLNEGNMLDMKYFKVDRVVEDIRFEDKNLASIKFRMPEIGEKVDINYKGSFDGFSFTIQSASKRLFKQEHEYQVNNEELSMIIEFDNLPQNVDMHLLEYFGPGNSYGSSLKEVGRSSEGRVRYEVIFHNDSGAVMPSTSIFLDQPELNMSIRGYTIIEHVNWRFELK